MAHEGTHRIGWVAAVDSERLTIELDSGTTGLVKGGLSGILPVGTINSYVTVPAGPTRLVAVVTAIRVSESPPQGTEPYAGQENISRRLEAVMVGRFDSGGYSAGITTYPPLYAPASSATSEEIEAIFSPGDDISISVGEAVVAPGVDVRLRANALMARHCAVLGSTGAGKSCTVTAVVEELLKLDVPFANILIIDSNGEYASAFSSETERGRRANTSVIGPEPGENGGLFVPHWFMDNEDHTALFRASEGIQAPLLQRAVADARLSATEQGPRLRPLLYARSVSLEMRNILTNAGVNKPQEKAYDFLATLRDHADQLKVSSDPRTRDLGEHLSQALTELNSLWSVRPSTWSPLSASQHTTCSAILDALETAVQEGLAASGIGEHVIASDFDAPRYYSLEALNEVVLPYRIDLESINEDRIRNYAAGLLMRLARLLADARYNFMTRVPQHEDSLASFLRLLLGADPLYNSDDNQEPPWAATYKERRIDAARAYNAVTILDLSLVASDVLENVTALIGRLVLDFLQRVEPRGNLPVLLVLEEAHRYIPANRETRARAVFERMAKEGRKYGLGMLVASQRPSELASTVLSQCGTLIAHRTVNPMDQDLVRNATPFASRDLLRQLPGLATQHAVVLGEAAPVPVHARIRNVVGTPRGADPRFLEEWSKEPTRTGVFEEITREWEGPLPEPPVPNTPNPPAEADGQD